MTLEGRRLAVPVRGRARALGRCRSCSSARRPSSRRRSSCSPIVGAANSVEDVAGFTLLQRLVPDRVLTRVLGSRLGPRDGRCRARARSQPRSSSKRSEPGRPSSPSARSCRSWRSPPTAGSPRSTTTSLRLPSWSSIEQVPMFAPLSVAAKERVAANLVPLSVSRRRVRDPRGEVGDRFYIVGEGELEIAAERAARTACAQADYFGEIALLRDVPRTATVTALVDSRLYRPPARGLPRRGHRARGRPRRRPRRRRAAAGRHGGTGGIGSRERRLVGGSRERGADVSAL